MTTDRDAGYKVSDVKLIVTLPNEQTLACNTRNLQVLDDALKAHIWDTDQESHTLPVTIELPDGDVIKTAYEIDLSRQPFRFSYGGFVEWVAYELEDWERLAPLELNRYAEVHVSYAHLYYYLTVRRSDSQISLMKWGLRQKSYSFRQISFASRLKLIELLSYSWTFSFEDSDWGHHYYSGSLEQVHYSLLAAAQGRDRVADVDQMVAFEGLIHLYRLAPDVMRFVNLSDIMFFATMTLPGYYNMLAVHARMILDLLKTRHEKYVRNAEDELASQVEHWLTRHRDSQVVLPIRTPEPVLTADLYLSDSATLNKPRISATPSLTTEEKLKIASASKPKPFGFK